MLLRFAVFGMMALGLAGFGTVAFLALHQPTPVATVAADQAAIDSAAPPPPPKRHLVLVAAQPLRAGLLLKPDDVTVTDTAEFTDGMQEDTPAQRAALTGSMLRRNIALNEPVLAADVMRPGERGFLAAVLQPGHRAASVSVDAATGSAGLIWPGDHVDLILTQSLDDSTLPLSRRVAAETVLADLRVIAIDQLLIRGVAPPVDGGTLNHTVTLEVLSADAEKIAVATRLGRLSIAVRAAQDATHPVEPGVTTTTWGGDVSPALGGPAPQKASGVTLKLYQGSAEAKEIKF